MKNIKLTSLSIAIATSIMLSGCGSDSDSTPEQEFWHIHPWSVR